MPQNKSITNAKFDALVEELTQQFREENFFLLKVIASDKTTAAIVKKAMSNLRMPSDVEVDANLEKGFFMFCRSWPGHYLAHRISF